ncbi:MAG: hypothetical protein PHG91_00245 [Syntrophales bacterium]|jgi:hypothetical protein|nr:hypothetical protein [Syntrophales bacterium]MDD5231798.1 hypothetical protein [Syntrophales bacterium]MDD5531220.1 hypothetical protein [Syntrophales bacterium]HPL63894.1 hypothetical protein [Syntrophales bacterium]
MTISPYQVNSILQAYSKQNKVKPREVSQGETAQGSKYNDIVSLSTEQERMERAYKKISYSLLDIILKGKSE